MNIFANWQLYIEGRIFCILSHHAAVEILLHLAEGVRGGLSFARDDDADVGDGQGSVWLALGCPAVGDVDALGGIAADVGWTTRGCGLDEVAALLQSLLPLIQHAVCVWGGRGGGSEDSSQPNKTPHQRVVNSVSTT